MTSDANLYNAAPTTGVVHLPRAARRPFVEVFGGGQSSHMRPQRAANIDMLNESLSCRMVTDTSQMEVNLLDRYLDILATAEVPGTPSSGR